MTRPTRQIPVDTLDKQRRAADPGTSAWVSANAGSGKTFVLTRRVVRLLLDGVPPSRILCLTFTKAAAAHMAIGVYDTLSAWVPLDDAKLADAIQATGAPRPGPVDLARARRLFARAVETPGGLKILTIHAFCERLLHSVPFEANVAARFAVIDELRQQDLLSRAQEAVLAQAVAEPHSALGVALEGLAGGLSRIGFTALTQELAGHSGTLRAVLQDESGLAVFTEGLHAALGTGGQGLAEVERAMVEGGLPPSEWHGAGRHLVACTAKGCAVGDRLIAAAAAHPDDRLETYLDVYFTQKRDPRADSQFLSKAVRTAAGGLCSRLDRERERLTALLELRRAAAAVERTTALLAVAGAVLDRYEVLKRRRGLLDFADLIERTRLLLARSDAAWVLYKLDAGIDHVLVDEAQDTSPDQWEILDAISRDFFAGAGRSQGTRTMFAVGDEKQSIYSFQGARPAMFDQARRHLSRRAVDAGQRFETIDLVLSFRSVATVLRMVDAVFAHDDNARGLSAGGEKPLPHQALKGALPGRFELWPLVGPEPGAEPTDWRLPVDAPEARDPAVVVAGRIAAEVFRLIAPGSGESVEAADGGRRPVRPGDVLILVRTRNAVFDAVIRALKERHVPVAGADRLQLTDHIAVMDLVAAGRAALLPDDDLTLACLLKSPLFGFSDEDLMRLAPRRTGSLEAELRASGEPRDRVVAARLGVWRDRAAVLTPFAFYTRLLGLDGGRKALLARLGPEASDVIDEFLALTLAHEQDGAPSLLTFLARLEGAELSIKRDMEAASDAVRVMTVHAAKGLEAKIVFLPDICGAPTGRHDARLFRLDEDAAGQAPLLAWSPRVDSDSAAIAARRAAGREAALDEHRRLLYVAMTRAEERLIVAGFHGSRGPALGCWYDMIVAASLPLTAVPAPWDAKQVVMRHGEAMPAPDPGPALAARPAGPLPAWLTRAAPAEVAPLQPLRPSTVLQAADRPDRPPDDAAVPAAPRQAALVGRLVHRLLQHMPGLPAAARRDAGLRFLARHGRSLTEEHRGELVAAAVAIIADPRLRAAFGPGSQAEVGIAALLDRPARPPLPVNGRIDRLGEAGGEVVLVDYKTGLPREMAETPAAILTQLALYRAAVQPLYPGRRVRTVLVWTTGPVVVEIDGARLDEALAAVLYEGGPPPRRKAEQLELSF